MAERIRLFKSATELNYSKAQIVKSNDYIVDHAFIDIEAESTVTVSSAIDFKKKDGSTVVFTAKVNEIKTPGIWVIEALTNGFELMNLWIEQVYENKSPEYIVENIIGQTLNLTYASSSSSGRELEKYVAKGYAIDIIKDMKDTLDWQVTIDQNDNVSFDPKEFIDNGVTLTNGTDIQIDEWIIDKRNMINEVKVIGGFENHFTTGEAKVGSGTEFTLTHKPNGVVRAVVSGSEVSADDYVVDGEDKKVIFTTSKTDPSFDYSYNVPVVVLNHDDESINTYDPIFKEVPAPWLNRVPDARIYSQQILDVYSTPLTSAKGYEAGLNFNREIGEVITLTDPLRNRTERLIVTKIVLDTVSQKTKLTFGTREYLLYDWEREVEERIKKIERRETNEDSQVFARLHKTTLKITLTETTTFKKNSPVDSWAVGHKTLARVRNGITGEPDCSDNNLTGTWQGTGIDGSQYTTSGYRLSAGDFNGTDNYIDITGSAGATQSVSFYINPDAVNTDIIQLSATAKISVDNSSDITTTGLSNVTIYVDGTVGTAITLSTWQLVTVTFDAHTCNDIELGRETSYFNGKLDEVMLFDSKITVANMTTIINKDFYNTSNVFTISGLLGYWSMDNCKVGNRADAKVTVS